ncbi:MAG: sigma 54-interacting transcriptional regulator [Treponema sp.]|nr:sigma 54-interacting transcriptional regulator [Treponema sp.]
MGNTHFKVSFITQRSSVGSLFSTLFESVATISVINVFSTFPSEYEAIPIFDAELFTDDKIYNAILESNDLNRIACLFLPGTSDLAQIRVEKTFCNILTFPCESAEFLNFLKKISRSIEYQTQKIDIQKYGIQKIKNTSIMGFFCGHSKLIEDVRKGIQKAALNENPVLLLGETGTGKTTAAKLIHKLSSRRHKAFESFNVSTVVDTLSSSTFFGTESGAYTDALKHKGIFRSADNGTLLLDEIGLASEKVQQMLLEVLETQKIKSVGSDKVEKINVRMIFATNAALNNMLKTGSFRSDLYYRISDSIIRFPALRKRKEDIRDIVKNYLETSEKKISETAISHLEKYDWPGNIRELRQCLKRAIENSGSGTIQTEHLDFGLFNL